MCFEQNTIEEYDVLEREFSKQLGMKTFVAPFKRRKQSEQFSPDVHPFIIIMKG